MGKEIRDPVLFHRLQNYSKNHSLCDVDDAVRFLRLNFSEYKRKKFDTLRKYILPTLISLQDDDDDSVRIPSKRRKKNIDSFKDDLLLRKEHEHLKKRRSRNDSSEEEDGQESTSEGFHFEDDEEEDPEPKFDLMKQILRSNYSNHKLLAATNPISPNSESKGVEKNIEEEVVRTERKIEANSTHDGSRVETVIQGKNESKSEVDFRGKGVGPSPSFRDFGGMKEILNELLKDVIIPLLYPQLPQWYGVKPMTGILLHGPPGCGKTKLAHAIANETGLPFYKISATEVVSGVSGASEENIRDLFSKACRTAPSIVFIDEIDAIASKRENLQREMERRIVTQLLSCMDESHQTVGSTDLDSDSETYGKRTGHVLVIGATNRPDAVDPALRRPGRFDREIALGIPNESARLDILSVLTSDLRLEGEFDLQKIARITPGFVGADLVALVNTAKNLAMRKTIDRRESELCTESGCNENKEGWWRHPWLLDEMERHAVTLADFEKAAKKVQPSSRREGFSTIPNVKWEDVGGLDWLRKEFERYIVRRIKHPEDYEELGMDLDTGFLLYGPPGCGKTLIAKAVANEAGANFIHIKGPELLNKYVGESELAVRTTFNRARACSPCILFFDEVDALTTNRGKEGGWVVERLLNQLLLELDGADQRKGVFVIGATNRPEVMDSAVLRPGRFGKLLYVPLPRASERASILKALARKKPLSPDVDLDALARSEACTNLSGADLSALLDEAAMIAIEEKQMASDRCKDGKPFLIHASYLERALKKITPSVLEEQRKFYEIKSRVFGSGLTNSAAN